jgi:hypothetical protein
LNLNGCKALAEITPRLDRQVFWSQVKNSILCQGRHGVFPTGRVPAGQARQPAWRALERRPQFPPSVVKGSMHRLTDQAVIYVLRQIDGAQDADP